MPTADHCASVIKKLKPNKPFLLSPTELSMPEKQTYYHASRRERMKVSIRTLANGTWITKVE